MHGYMYCVRSLCAPPGLVQVTLASDWVEKRGPRVRLPARCFCRRSALHGRVVVEIAAAPLEGRQFRRDRWGR
eukprot:5486846-Prymnesium_polylepis.1